MLAAAAARQNAARTPGNARRAATDDAEESRTRANPRQPVPICMPNATLSAQDQRAMPRFAHIFEAAADTLNAYYQAVAEANIDSLMGLWIDEEFVSCITAEGAHLHGLPNIRAGLAAQLEAAPVSIEPLDIRVYDSLGTVVYAIVEAHRPVDPAAIPAMVFTTYVMVHERGEWRIAHIHASRMPDDAATQFSARLRHGQGALH
ncbi:SnoaL-like protein [Paraburkholderia unamae]|nr:SnoaL-like protein [Paraburkholderia unamae]